MSFADKKLELSLAGLSVLVLFGSVFFDRSPENVATAERDVVYEMPRPKLNFLSALFSLGEREVERKYHNPFEKKKAAVTTKAAPVVAKPAAPVANNQKKGAPSALPQKVSSLPQQPKQMDVTIIPADSSKGLSQGEGGFRTAGTQSYGTTDSVQPQGENNPNGVVDNLDKGISGSQWRALILAQPTAENVEKLIAALRAGQVDAASYYTILEDLLRDGRSEHQLLAMSMAKAFHTSTSFSIVVQYYETLSKDQQKDADQFLYSFAIPSRFATLKTLLKHQDADVVSMAVQVVLNGYKYAQNGGAVASDPRNSRGDGKGNTQVDYSQFVPVLRELALSSNSTIAQQAMSALSQMQTAVAAL